MDRTRVLILGGSAEASALVRALEGDPLYAPILSLAGQTRQPVLPAIPTRIGGFGGTAGLVQYLVAERIAAVVTATHPFAAQMPRHAAAAAAETGLPHLILTRPAWVPEPGDNWHPVPDMRAAALALGPAPRRVLLTIGRRDLGPFQAAPQHDYLIRSIDPPPADRLPPQARLLTRRGPFTLAEERELMSRERIEWIVTKNAGGTATEAKLQAARGLGLPVIMVARPPPVLAPQVLTVPAALAWLRDLHQRA